MIFQVIRSSGNLVFIDVKELNYQQRIALLHSDSRMRAVAIKNHPTEWACLEVSDPNEKMVDIIF